MKRKIGFGHKGQIARFESRGELDLKTEANDILVGKLRPYFLGKCGEVAYWRRLLGFQERWTPVNAAAREWWKETYGEEFKP